ncbi:vitamin K epoxide reductase complex subunit 1-like [Ornithodoros turicata]|uniref:vitamin K epoxide reductase complex subunit 1-like n=1 Tax=Ornithodoros turicata TaxID=34597 RepID=UPI0031398F69
MFCVGATLSDRLRFIRTINSFLCVFGVVLSIYAYHVETQKERDSQYVAMCDVSAHMSCSKVFTSRFGRGFGLLEYLVGRESPYNQPNSVFGVIFYVTVFVCGLLPGKSFGVTCISMSLLSILGSVYLACILYFVLHDFCFICVTTYVINFFLLVCSVCRLRTEGSLEKQKQQ